MKILFLSTWYPYPPDNGSKLRVYHLLRALTQAHKVTLVSFAFDTAEPKQLEGLRPLCADVQVALVNPFVVNQAGILNKFVSLRPVASRPVAAMHQLVTDALQAHSFDAVIASTEMMADYALMVPGTTPRILEEHNSMTRWARERYEGAKGPVQRARCWASWSKRRWYEARLFPHFDLVTMVSKVDRQTTIDTIGADRLPVEVVPNGVDCGHNRPGLAQPRPHALIYNGALTYGANYDAMRWFLAEVFPRIKAEVPDVSLAITGSTEGVDLAGLALDDAVTLTGYVSDVRRPVAEATLCVVPIRRGGGTRLKILEAMALGTPVLATSKGAEGLDVVDGAHLLLADDPESFARRTVDLLGNADRCARLAANARCLVEARYDWGAIGQRFVSLVEASVRQRKSQTL